jgi:hypothetical protein
MSFARRGQAHPNIRPPDYTRRSKGGRTRRRAGGVFVLLLSAPTGQRRITLTKPGASRSPSLSTCRRSFQRDRAHDVERVGPLVNSRHLVEIRPDLDLDRLVVDLRRRHVDLCPDLTVHGGTYPPGARGPLRWPGESRQAGGASSRAMLALPERVMLATDRIRHTPPAVRERTDRPCSSSQNSCLRARLALACAGSLSLE